MTDTALSIRADQSGGTLSVFDRVDPLAFIETFGRTFALTGAGGCKTAEDGKLMALACLCERKTIFEIGREFHLMDGKLSMRADAMLAKFRQIGGKHIWVKTGDDGLEAACDFIFDGQTTQVRYTIEDAKRAGLVKEKGNWIKSPGPMLRARVISNAIRMIAPEVVAGYYTPEENEDVAADRPAAPAANAETVKAVKQRAKEIKEMNSAGTTSTAPAASATTPTAAATETATSNQGEVIDAEFTVTNDAKPDAAAVETATTATAATETVSPAVVPEIAPNFHADAKKPTDATQPGSAMTETLMEIEVLLGKIGVAKATIEEQIRKKNPEVTTLDSMSEVSALQLCKNLEAKVAQLKK